MAPLAPLAPLAIPIMPEATTPPRSRFAVLLLALANLVPLAGVIWWGWDAFLLLALYWSETAIIGFWTILEVMVLQVAAGGAGRYAAAIGLGAFFTIHASIFMGVHMTFLWSMAAGVWQTRVHGVTDFVGLIIIGAGLWIPLAALFAARGAFVINELVNRLVFARPANGSGGNGATGDGTKSNDSKGDAMGAILSRFYQRIVLMHVAIIFGGMAAIALGSVAPLVILVLAKTALEIGLMSWARLTGSSAGTSSAPST